MILAMPEAAFREEKTIPSQADKQGSFEELFRELYRPVFSIFAKKGCSSEDCQDLASETFLRAYKSYSDFQGKAKPLTWLHTIATNVWLNRIRDSAAAKRDGIEVAIVDDGRSEPAFHHRPHDRTISEERQRLLKLAIDKLPPKMRRCVWLRVYQDMSYRDIADLLDVNVTTAKSQVSLARARLRSLLAEHYPDLDRDLGD